MHKCTALPPGSDPWYTPTKIEEIVHVELVHCKPLLVQRNYSTEQNLLLAHTMNINVLLKAIQSFEQRITRLFFPKNKMKKSHTHVHKAERATWLKQNQRGSSLARKNFSPTCHSFHECPFIRIRILTERESTSTNGTISKFLCYVKVLGAKRTTNYLN